MSEEDDSEGKPNHGEDRIIGCLQQTSNHSHADGGRNMV